LLILCYHGVSLGDEHEWDSGLFVTPEFLRRRFTLLRKNSCTVLQLGEAVRRLRMGTLPSRSVVLTFDDGYYNFAAAALPVLEEFGYPATNYVSSFYCIHQVPVPTITMRYILWCARHKALEPGDLPGQPARADLRTEDRRIELAQSIFKSAAAGGHEAQQALLTDVADRLGVDWRTIWRERRFHLLAPNEIAEMSRRGVDVQLHTHRHRVPRDKTQFCNEIQENRSFLERTTGRPANHFCYPSGEVDPDFLPWLRDLNVESATTTIGGNLAHADHDPLLLPRFVDTMGRSELEFESWVCGPGAMLRHGH
jgi:peptidoglycan/xylan/chitin deacetylase (PgdA/CDA1 family)